MIDVVCADYEGNDLKVLLSAKQIKEMRTLIWKITFSKKRYLEACDYYWNYNIYGNISYFNKDRCYFTKR